jgi:hypothetical protein
MLEEVKGRQAKMANIQSAMQSGDIKSGCVVRSVWRKPLNRMSSCSISALLAGDEEPKTSGARAQPASSGASTHRKGGNKNKKR